MMLWHVLPWVCSSASFTPLHGSHFQCWLFFCVRLKFGHETGDCNVTYGVHRFGR